MKCEMMDREQRLDDFLLNKLPVQEAESFEQHVFGCPECLAELRLRGQMIKLIKEERITAIGEVTQSRRAKPRAGFLGAISDFFRVTPNAWIYAGVVAALVILILVSPIFRGKEAAENYAANFAVSPRLESLIGQALRSADLAVSVISPRHDEQFSSGDILFRWHIKRGEESVELPLELKILNNQEALIHNFQVKGQEYRLRERLTPGLYYWTLEYQGEMAYLGKFTISEERR